MAVQAQNASQKIGILGGTFDPPHLGHIKLATHFSKLLHLDQLLLIPSGEPWQKGVDITPANIRLQLTQAAGLDLAQAFIHSKINTAITVDRIEIERSGPSYAIDTAKALRAHWGMDASLIWLMGADAFNQLPTWNSWKHLINYVNLAVASRPDHPMSTEIQPELTEFLNQHLCIDPETLENSRFGRIYIDDSLAVDLSSTHLRNQLNRADRSLITPEHIPARTLERITTLGLYKQSS